MLSRTQVSKHLFGCSSLVIAGLAGLGLGGCDIIKSNGLGKSQEADLIALFDNELGSGREVSNPPISDTNTKRIAITGTQHNTSSNARILAAMQCIEDLKTVKSNKQMADPTNYGKRIRVNSSGNPIHSQPLFIVLHETVSSEEETLNYFRTPHLNDANQASYHVLIGKDGTRIRIVEDKDRAFGAGESSYRGFTVRIKPETIGSLNNVALHISLVSPHDGREDTQEHSGYTQEQYRSLALQTLIWQVQYGISRNRVTTHQAIDQSGTRRDPRSFDWDLFNNLSMQYAQRCGAVAYVQEVKR